MPKCHVWDNDVDYSTEERAEFKVIHNKWASREQAAAMEAAAARHPHLGPKTSTGPWFIVHYKTLEIL
jgi:hypothetical protein